MAATIDDNARKLLEEPNYAVVATLREDGSVHTVVAWQHIEGDKITMNSAEGRDWPANLRRDPRVTVTVVHRENPYEWVALRGSVVEDTHEGADEHINALSKKYIGQDEYPFRQPGEQRIRFVVEPENVVYVKQG